MLSHPSTCFCALAHPVALHRAACCCQVVVSEASGQVSTSEVRQVALLVDKAGSRLVTPKRRFPLDQTTPERLMLWLDWTRTFRK